MVLSTHVVKGHWLFPNVWIRVLRSSPISEFMTLVYHVCGTF